MYRHDEISVYSVPVQCVNELLDHADSLICFRQNAAGNRFCILWYTEKPVTGGVFCVSQAPEGTFRSKIPVSNNSPGNSSDTP